MKDHEADCWICGICGYEYVASAGDVSRNIPPGTPWNELPDDWCCPDCQMSKSEFVPSEIIGEAQAESR
jgi:rubredoxin